MTSIEIDDLRNACIEFLIEYGYDRDWLDQQHTMALLNLSHEAHDAMEAGA